MSSKKYLPDMGADELAGACRERHLMKANAVHPKKLLKARGN
jgi:hypothetical protein